jgi:hypothetical protein
MTKNNESENIMYSCDSTFFGNSIEEKVIEIIQKRKIDALPLPRALLYAVHMKDQKESRLRLGLGIMRIYEGLA